MFFPAISGADPWIGSDVSNAGLRGKCQESDDVCAHDVIDGYFGEGRSLRETKLSNEFGKVLTYRYIVIFA